jgi:hypothetical protein
LILIAKYEWFTNTPLLVIVSGVVIDDWNSINKDMLVKKVINVVFVLYKRNNLRQEKNRKDNT